MHSCVHSASSDAVFVLSPSSLVSLAVPLFCDVADGLTGTLTSRVTSATALEYCPKPLMVDTLPLWYSHDTRKNISFCFN
jgi:hypothetical protein